MNCRRGASLFVFPDGFSTINTALAAAESPAACVRCGSCRESAVGRSFPVSLDRAK